ncbi:MAG: aldo/keto reductase [Armatimonadetes bacterium]|nr:aldo/keto reductase [Armatimonadota bacterium]
MTDDPRPFQTAPDAVDPARVPHRTLPTGATIPALGLGTFGSDHVSGEQIAAAVITAAELGYRHFDCAAVYGNEALIGQSLQTIMAGGVKREDLWITSKLWNDKHDEADVIPAFRQSLADLQLDYLDLYLIHWPFPNWHPPHADVTSRSPNARGFILEEYLKIWRQLEKLVAQGLVRHIGVSNMTIPKFEAFLPEADIKPAAHELELHPHFQQPELFRYTLDHGMLPIGYCPLGSPGRPERDRTPEDTLDMEDPVIVSTAQRLGVHPAAVCLTWAVQRGQVPIPMSANPRNIRANLQAVAGDPLTDDDMAAIAQIDKNCRLVKAPVFLWKEGQTWEALWDLDGHITPP